MCAALRVDLDQRNQVGGDLHSNDTPKCYAVVDVARPNDLEKEDGEGDAAKRAAGDGKCFHQDHPFQGQFNVW